MVIIGIPAYNEEKNIASIITKLSKEGYQILVCNDASSDMTGEIAEKLGAVVINHEKNKGYGGSIRSIFLKAKELNSDILVTFDADGQHRIKDISKLLEALENDQADVVIGSRFLGDESTDMPSYRKKGIKVITKISNISSKNKLTDSQSGLRAYNNNAINKITPSELGMGASTEILIKANKNKLKIIEVPIKVLYEGDTSTHNPVSHGASVILSTMKFISIDNPLKFYGIPGLSFLTIGLFFIVWTLQIFGETRQIITNISLIGIGVTILGIIFLMTAIILFSMVTVVRDNRK
jgi:glycosyltransferase involved in cell wall biosynthesis